MLPEQLTAELGNTQAASSQHCSFRGTSSSSQRGGDLKRSQTGLLRHGRQESTSSLQAAPRRQGGRDPFLLLRVAAVPALVLCTKLLLQTTETFPESSASTAQPESFAGFAANQQLWELPRSYIRPQKTSSSNWC